MAVTAIWPIEGRAINVAGDMVAGSLADKVVKLGAYFSEESKVYPTMTAGATVVSANADWTLGALATIIPASTITVPFYLHAVVLESCSKNAVFELVMYQSGGDTEFARIRFAVSGGFFGNYYVLSGPLVPADARVRAALACSTGTAAAATITMSLIYHEAV
ncbi:MAG: hypothetical protein KKF27_20740 [Gammaproteobacteria bacterium]|nr:hypothetical protein [Gammaproteobacteria bacterium]